jgi:replication-associated recombination protein RarA
MPDNTSISKSKNKPQLFWEKYRPTKLEDAVLPERIRKIVDIGIESGNLIFTGSPGLGKTTLAGILTSKYDTLKINASSEGSVDTLRGKISEFCRTRVINPKSDIKVVWLEEFDRASDAMQDALRAYIEQWSGIAHFIATCNHIEKIDKAILSRFTLVDFNPRSDEVIEWKKGLSLRISKVAEIEGITINKDEIKGIINRTFPDFRSMMNALMLHKIDPKLLQSHTLDFKEDVRKLIEDKSIGDVDIVLKIDAMMITEHHYIAAFDAIGTKYIIENIKKGIWVKEMQDLVKNAAKYLNVNHRDPKIALMAYIFEFRKSIYR